MNAVSVDRKERCSITELMTTACQKKVVIPAFNVPYLPMMEPIIRAVVDQGSFALIEVARLEWLKFESRSLRSVMEQFFRYDQPDHVRLHLDHVPVIDEDNQQVDFLPIIREAIELGYHSVMLDASRLDLEGNIAATRQVVEIAHSAGVACEAELGAVLGHESGPLPPYDELFESGKGFTDIEQAKRFVAETDCDWLSIAIGNVHGPITKAFKDEKKIQARLNLTHLESIARVINIPLVLHGGSGIKQEDVLEAIQSGICKVNIATEIRQPYESNIRENGDVSAAREAVYEKTSWIIKDYLQIAGSKHVLMDGA